MLVRKVNIFVRNTTQHDIVLPGKTVIGSIQRIIQSWPLYPDEHQVNLVVAEHSETVLNPTEEKSQSNSQDQLWDPLVNPDQLTDEIQVIVKTMLREESGAFTKHKDEVGYIKNLEMDIKLTDNVPVAKAYNAIP